VGIPWTPCNLLPDPKSWMRDGYAPSWGVETPNRVKRAERRVKDSLAFAVGEPATYVQAPKAKGRRNRTLFGFPTPRSRVYRAVCGGAPQMFFPDSFEETDMIPLPFSTSFLPHIGNRTVRYSHSGLLRYDCRGLASISSQSYSKFRVSRRRIARSFLSKP
jgi:hypothetical protein